MSYKEAIDRLRPDKNCLRKTVRAEDLKSIISYVEKLEAECEGYKNEIEKQAVEIESLEAKVERLEREIETLNGIDE